MNSKLDIEEIIYYKKLSEQNIRYYNFIVYCNNFLLSILKMSDEYKWTSITVKKKSNKWIDTSKFDMLYLRTHGYSKEINPIYYRHILFSLLRDYIEYTNNTISCICKGQVASAYTLLRKPLKDDLLLIELLYNKGHRFMNSFLKTKIDFFSIDGIEAEEKKKIIFRSCKKNLSKGSTKKSKMLYDIRYNKNSNFSFEPLWSKASHIITTYPKYKTEDGNLNMIFIEEKGVDSLVNHFFNIMPTIQSYLLSIILNILKRDNLINESEYQINSNLISLKSIYAVKGEINLNAISFNVICPYCNNDFIFKSGTAELNFIGKDFNYPCPKCKHNVLSNFFIKCR